MKKPILPILSCLLAFGLLAGCGSKADPLELHQKALDAAAAVTTVEAQVNYAINVTFDGETSQTNVASELRQIRRSDGDMDLELQNTITYAEGEAEQLAAYYRDGKLYQNYVREDFKSFKDVEDAGVLLRVINLPIAEAAVLNSSSTKTADGQTLRFSLSPEQMEAPLVEVAAGMMLNIGSDMDGITCTFDEVRYEETLDKSGKLVSCEMTYAVDMKFMGEVIGADCRVTVDNIRTDTLTEIVFPTDLADYYDLNEDASGAEEGSFIDPENRYSPIPSDYTVTNNISETCNAVQFLSSEGEYLDYLFWMLYQTQAGVSAPAEPKGYATASEISAEGLVRFFCFVNEHQLESIADPGEQMYYLHDDMVNSSLVYFFDGYNYDPATLPAELGYQSPMLMLPFELCKPAANPCRIDTVEVLDETRLQITATGLAADETTELNTQVMIVEARDDGNTIFEMYTITPV